MVREKSGNFALLKLWTPCHNHGQIIHHLYVPECFCIVPHFFGYKNVFCFLPKQSQKSRSILTDGSRFLGLFRKGKLFWWNFALNLA